MRDLFISIFLLVISSSVVHAGSVFVEVGAGYNANLWGQSIENGGWDNGGGVGSYISVRYETKKGVCHWTHLSQWDVGKPWNHTRETKADHFGCALRWRIK